MDKWWSSDFSIQTWCTPLEAFAPKKAKLVIVTLLQLPVGLNGEKFIGFEERMP